MYLFWIIACTLTFGALAVLLLALVRPQGESTELARNRLLHRVRSAELRGDVDAKVIDEQDMQGAQDEIDRSLLEESSADSPLDKSRKDAAQWLTITLLLFAIPSITMFTYLTLGQLAIATGAKSHPQQATEIDAQQIDELLSSLKQRLTDDPQSAEGWLLLGRSYMALGRYDEAVDAFANTHELVGDNPQLLLQYADALAQADSGRIGKQSRELVARSLAIEPDNVGALWLAGLGAAEVGNEEQALDYLRRARTLSASDGASTVQLDSMIARLEGASNTMPLVQAATASISVSVDIAPSLRALVEPTDTLFVFARTPSSSGPPLAVTRVNASVLPFTVVLDESMAMAPMFKLQRGQNVTVTARISKSGTPGAQSGDLQTTSGPVVVGEPDLVNLTIDKIVE